MIQVRSPIPAKILIVDDLPDNLRLLSKTLKQEGFDVRSAINGPLAIMGAETDPPDLILLDITMPEMDGFEVCHRLKTNLKTADIPIVFITALGEVTDKVKGLELGGADYITKPFHLPEVLARVNLQLELHGLKDQLKQQNQQLQATLLAQRKVEEQIRQLNQELEQRVVDRTQQLETANQQLQREMQERQHTQEQLLYMAQYDSLTGLANRTLLLKHLETTLQMIQQSSQSETVQCLLVLVDCDRFKSISNTLGHHQGDRLLREIAKRITATVPTHSLVARLGGDEFAIALTITTVNDSTDTIVNNLQRQLAVPIRFNNLNININATIGMVLADTEGANAEYLLRDAELAMVQAKKQQQGSCQLFKPEMHQQALYELELEGQLRQAIEQQQLQVYYQPIVALSADPTDSTIVGYEALARWQPALDADFIPPSVFIPLAEKTGLIEALGDWVLATACQQITQWNQQGKRPLFLSINVSIDQLTCPDCLNKILAVFQHTQVNPSWIKLEVTESIFMKTPQPVLDTLTSLRKQGVKVSIDDFGTGYSSLSYLKHLPIDTVKIDRTFIQDMESSRDSLNILQAILNLTQALQLETIAEGIETCDQAQTLANLGCVYGQGYRFGKPVDSQKAATFIQTQAI